MSGDKAKISLMSKNHQEYINHMNLKSNHVVDISYSHKDFFTRFPCKNEKLVYAPIKSTKLTTKIRYCGLATNIPVHGKQHQVIMGH